MSISVTFPRHINPNESYQMLSPINKYNAHNF